MLETGDRPVAGPAERLRQDRVEKIAVLLGLAVGICVPYFALQHIHWFPTRTVPAVALDHWVVFSPAWVWVYLSIAALVPAAPVLVASRDALVRYRRGLVVMCLVSFATFLFFPVAGPRPESVPDHAVYAWLVGVDRPLNSMPSLHAGLVVYSVLCLARSGWGGLQGSARTLGAAGLVAWAGAILYATLATKQHWFVDLPAGALFAWGAHALAWRGAAQR